MSKKKVKKKLKQSSEVFVLGTGAISIEKKDKKYYVLDGRTKVEMSMGLNNMTECYIFIADAFGEFQVIS